MRIRVTAAVAAAAAAFIAGSIAIGIAAPVRVGVPGAAGAYAPRFFGGAAHMPTIVDTYSWLSGIGSGPPINAITSAQNGPPGAPGLLWFTAGSTTGGSEFVSSVDPIRKPVPVVNNYGLGKNVGVEGVDVDEFGHVWVAERNAGIISEIIPTGSSAIILPFAIPSIHHPRGIVEGVGESSGSMFVTDDADGYIGRISITNPQTDYAAYHVGGKPYGIAQGATNLWYTDMGSAAVVKLDKKGIPTDWVNLAQDSKPVAIAPQPDGSHMWVTALGSSSVCRVIINANTPPKDRATCYAVPGKPAGAKPAWAMVAGITPDRTGNAMWFAARGGASLPNGGIGIVDTTSPNVGKMTLYTAGLSSGAAPDAITPGPGLHSSTLWFAETGRKAIGSIVP